MALRIITADERLAAPSTTNAVIFGPPGVGKTFQARTLKDSGASTLFLDGEAGMLAVKGDVMLPDGRKLPPFQGGHINMREEAARLGLHPWQLCVGIACWLAGPDPAAEPGSEYSAEMYSRYLVGLGDPAQMLALYDTIFGDSITVASRWSFDWAKRQPRAFSEKTGKPDTRGAYGLHGEQMVKWLTTLQHIPNKSVVMVGILQRNEDDMKRVSWDPQIEGQATGKALPGIFDTVLTLNNFKTDSGQDFRAFCCRQQNPWDYPAKDRSGRLDLLEPPDLGALLRKLATGPRVDTFSGSMPAPQPAAA